MTQGNYANVNGLALYYEIHGTGNPLILLHGGLGSVDMFTQLLPALSANHQVIGVDLQGNGHTADVDRAFSFEGMADDVAALIRHLNLGKADVAGFSLGGGAGLHLAMRHPELVRKLVLISIPFSSEGWFADNREGMRALMNPETAKMIVGSPPHQDYSRIAPRPEDWPVLVAKTGQLVSQDYDWSAGVSKLTMPVMLVYGDADAVRPEHRIRFYELLGGGLRDAGWDGSGMPKARLAMLPGTTHYNVFMSPLLAPTLSSFLDEPETA